MADFQAAAVSLAEEVHQAAAGHRGIGDEHLRTGPQAYLDRNPPR